MPRVNHVKHARLPTKCGRCGRAIEKGDPYLWAKTRYGPKLVRCPDHSFRASELTSSDKLSNLYSAQEDVEDEVKAVRDLLARSDFGHAELLEALRSLGDTLENSASQAEETGSEYQESADAVDEYFPGSSQVDEITEKAEAAEEFSSELTDKAGDARSLIEELEALEINEDGEALGELPVDEVESLLDEVEGTTSGLSI